MKNERGITLIELLAVIVLLSIISVILFSIATSGLNNFDRISTKQRLQQEGNYITEVIRNEYLRSTTDSSMELAVDNSKNELSMNENIISTGYTYELKDTKDPSNKTVEELTILEASSFHLLLTISKENYSYEIDTTLTKLK